MFFWQKHDIYAGSNSLECRLEIQDMVFSILWVMIVSCKYDRISAVMSLTSYELITSSGFKIIMMIAIIVNTVLMVMPIWVAHDSARVPLAIIENIIGNIFKFNIIQY